MEKLAIRGGTPVCTTKFPSWPQHDEREKELLHQVLESSRWGGTAHGPMVMELNARFCDYHDAAFGIPLTSCTAGLDIGLRAFDIGPGDEVIVPAFTFMATAFAPMYVGADVVFADVDPNSLCLDPAAVAAAITPRTRAIIPVHFGGYPAQIDELGAIAKAHNLAVIVDCAHAHGTEWAGKKVGGWGDLNSYSFNQAKNMTCGEGGLATTDNEALWERCFYTLACFGRKNGRPWYEHHELGQAYPMNEFQAAVCLPQLERLDEHTKRRNQNAAYLSSMLTEIPGLTVQELAPEVTQHGYHIYPMRLNAEEFGTDRETFLQAVQAEGIGMSSGYPWPLYDNPMFDKSDGSVKGSIGGFRAEPCPVTERLCHEEAAWIGQTTLLADQSAMDDIAAAIAKVQRNVDQLQAVYS